MLPNASSQQRAKHFDLLLARELALIKRGHQQNLITHRKLENSIRRDTHQIFNPNRNKISLPFDEIYNEQTETLDYHKMRIHKNNYSNQKHNSLTGSSQSQDEKSSDETLSQVSSTHRRYCLKAQRLPPIVKSNREKRSSKDLYWMVGFQQTSIQKEESINEPFTLITEDFPKAQLPKLPPLQKQIHSFLETLPAYKGIQRGFDNFAPASLYSRHVPIAI